MTMDKDALKKHHYWLVAGAALLLSLAAIFMLRTGVRASINSQKEEVENKLKSLQGQGEVKSRGAIEKKRKEAKAYKDQEILVWKEAFGEQEDLIRFPPEVEEKYRFSRDLQTGEIGFFLTAVTIHGPDVELEAQPLDKNTFKGVVQDSNEFMIRVKGSAKIVEPAKNDEEPKETIEDKELTFYNTPVIKVKKEGEDGRVVFAGIDAGHRVTVEFERGRYFNDPLTQQERTDFGNSYHDQFPGILTQVDPITVEGSGVVQLGAGGSGYWPFNGKAPETPMKFIHVIHKDQLNPVQDFSELAWIAQENVWIQREIYRLVDQANAYVRVFEPTMDPKKKEPGWVGKNAYWEARLNLKDENHLDVTLTNLLPRRQGLGIALLVWFEGAREPDRVPVGGASARDAKGGKNASFSTTVELNDGVDRGSIQRVEQVLTWDLAAVKRIDEVGIGADAFATPHSHRTFPLGLKPFKEEPKDEVEVGVQDADMGMLPGAPPMLPGAPGGGDMQGQAGVGQPGGKERYIEVSQQARRVPVAVSLIVDQQHVDRVQTSFANSKLRFLTTQVLMNRYPYSLNPNLNKKDAGMDGFGPGFGPGPMLPGPVPMGPRFPMADDAAGFPMGGFPGDPGEDFGFGFGAGQQANEELEANVELVLYGVVTLYERHPPRKDAGNVSE